jgi:hypothetical protein
VKLSPTDILKRHARERYLRIGIRSANLDGDTGSTPRMSESAWVDSCQLVRGVPAQLLDVLGLKECEGISERVTGLVEWNEEAREVMGVMGWQPTHKVATPLTLAKAAARLGLGHLDHKALKAMRLAAVAIVTENLLARRGRENGVGGMKTLIVVMCMCAMFSGCGTTGDEDPSAADATPAPACANVFDEACAGENGCGVHGAFCCKRFEPGSTVVLDTCEQGTTCVSDICLAPIDLGLSAPATAAEYEASTSLVTSARCDGYLPALEHLTLKSNGQAQATDWDNRVFASTWMAEPTGFALQPLPGQLDRWNENWSVPAVMHFVQTAPGAFAATLEWRDATRPMERCFFPTAVTKL